MERVFKIKTKTNTNPRFQYPSERRYSASVVLGFSIVFLQIFVYSVILGTLIIHKMVIHEQALYTNETSMEDANTTSFQRLNERVEKDLENSGIDYYSYINLPAMVCAGSYFMALGCLLSFVTGLLAWKRWYIDYNITFFFLSSSFSILASALSVLMSLLTIYNIFYGLDVETKDVCHLIFNLTVNLFILSIVGTMWSVLSTYIGYWGMKNCYPDDMVLSKAGRTIEVSTVRKGSKNCNPLPPDIINHFPVNDKLAKYLPKIENSNLPKAESNYEYQERVNKFLSGEPDSTENITK